MVKINRLLVGVFYAVMVGTLPLVAMNVPTTNTMKLNDFIFNEIKNEKEEEEALENFIKNHKDDESQTPSPVITNNQQNIQSEEQQEYKNCKNLQRIIKQQKERLELLNTNYELLNTRKEELLTQLDTELKKYNTELKKQTSTNNIIQISLLNQVNEQKKLNAQQQQKINTLEVEHIKLSKEKASLVLAQNDFMRVLDEQNKKKNKIQREQDERIKKKNTIKDIALVTCIVTLAALADELWGKKIIKKCYRKLSQFFVSYKHHKVCPKKKC